MSGSAVNVPPDNAHIANQRWVARNFGWSLVGLALLMGAVIWLAFIVRGKAVDADALLRSSYALGSALVLIIILGVSVVVGQSDGQLRDLVIGADKRASTSKFQYLLWTAGVAGAMCIVGARAFLDPGGSGFVCTDTRSTFCVPDDTTWQVYVALLGFPAAAAVIAKATVTSKTESGELQKTEAQGATIADLGTNDSGHADLVDIQYLIFNLIAFGYFAAKFFATGTFVAIPNILIGLTSASAATYAANKALARNRPAITSIQPTALEVGDDVVIKGVNLTTGYDAKDAAMRIRISIGGRPADNVTFIGTPNTGGIDTLRCTAPLGMSVKDTSVVVTTPAGVATDPFPVTVSAAAVLGWVATTPAVGDEGRLRVSGIPPQGAVEVRMGSSVVLTRADRPNGILYFIVPPTPVPKSTQQRVTVLVNGVTVAEGDVDLKVDAAGAAA